MEKTTLGIFILLGISTIGLIVLSALDAPTDALIPLITSLLGFLAGNNKENIISLFTPSKK